MLTSDSNRISAIRNPQPASVRKQPFEPEAAPPSDVFRPGSEEAQPSKPLLFSLSLEIPGSLVGGLAGMSLALVPEGEVRDRRWSGESQPIFPRVVFSALSAAPPPGQSLLLYPVPAMRSELGPLLEGSRPGQAGYYAPGGGLLLDGLSLQQTVQQAPQRCAAETLALGVTLEVPAELAGRMESSALALVPRQGPAASSAAPDVNFCLQWPEVPAGAVHIAVPLIAEQAPSDPYPLLQQALFPAEIREALRLDWVAGPLAREGFAGLDSLAALNRFRQRPVPCEQLSTPEGRRQFAAGYLLAQGLAFQNGARLYGHEAMERLKTAVYHQSPAALMEPEGGSAIPPEAIASLYPATEVKTGRYDPFRALGEVRAAGADTPAECIRTLADFLAPLPREAGSPMALFEAVLDSHPKRSTLAETSPHTSLGSLKETSDRILRFMILSRKVQGASLGLFNIPGSEAAFRKEERINRLLEELLQAASQGDERPLVELVAQRGPTPARDPGERAEGP